MKPELRKGAGRDSSLAGGKNKKEFAGRTLFVQCPSRLAPPQTPKKKDLTTIIYSKFL